MSSALQGKQSTTVMDLKATNKLLSVVQKTSNNGIRFVMGCSPVRNGCVARSRADRG